MPARSHERLAFPAKQPVDVDAVFVVDQRGVQAQLIADEERMDAEADGIGDERAAVMLDLDGWLM